MVSLWSKPRLSAGRSAPRSAPTSGLDVHFLQVRRVHVATVDEALHFVFPLQGAILGHILGDIPGPFRLHGKLSSTDEEVGDGQTPARDGRRATPRKAMIWVRISISSSEEPNARTPLNRIVLASYP
jgi:hypothetical protein